MCMLPILYEDDALLVVEKPRGLSAQEVASGDSVPQQLARQGKPVFPVHRLDRETAGVMVYARTRPAAAALSALVSQHTLFSKEYLALVSGCPAPAEGDMEDWLYHDARRNKSYPVQRPRKGVRDARLSYRRLATFSENGETVSLVAVRLHTGRTHQIRVQFASRKMPLLGDARYGGKRDCPLALYSWRLSFPHPLTGQPLSVRALPNCEESPWNRFSKKELEDWLG